MFYQIEEVYKDGLSAGSKAPQDISNIAKKLGFKSCLVHMDRSNMPILGEYIDQFKYANEWSKIYRTTPENSVILLQHTFRNKQSGRTDCLKALKLKKNCSFISIIHDVEELRELYLDSFHKAEFDFMLEISDVVIVHNDVMKKWIINKKGLNYYRVISLEVFDYLSDAVTTQKQFSKRVTVAGNLDPKKVGYLADISQIRDVSFDLYGVGWKKSQASNIEYHGAFKPNVLPTELYKGFGLVWDGSSVDTCSGQTGNYLRYNNPHKLSLYMSSSFPVIIWNEAAEAEFVKKYNVGFCVNSLYEIGSKISTMTEEQYIDIVRNCEEQSQRVRSGYYTSNAIKQAIDIINKMEQ